MEALFIKILNMSLAASGLILAAMALRLALRRAPRRLLCLLWALVGLRLLCPLAPANPWSLAPSAQTVPADIDQTSPPQIRSGIPVLNSAVNPALAQAEPAQPARREAELRPEKAGAEPAGGWLTALAGVWLAGAGALGGWSAFAAWRLNRRMKSARRWQDNVYQTEEAESPFVLGLFRPRIYLPADLPPQSADYVLAHEQSHIRQGDHWIKALGWLILCLHWFNPLVWGAYALLCRDLELACDESVVRRMDKKQIAGYAQTLLDCSRPRPAGPLAFGRLGVKARVGRILGYKRPAFWLAPATVLACGLAAFFWMTDPGQGPETPVESNIQSISIRQGEQIRQTQDRKQIQAVVSALSQARPSGKKALGEGQFILWLDDGGSEINRWKWDDQGLLLSPDQKIYRLGSKQRQTLEEAYRQGKEEDAYTITALRYGQAGQELTLTEDQADIARQCLWNHLVISAAFPGQNPAELPQCWRLRSGGEDYYIYLQEERPVIQMGAQGHYTMLSEALFRQLIGQPEGGEGEALALLAPVQGEISGTFGVRIHPVSQEQKAHNGIDFAGQVGDSVVASADGTVVEAGWDETYGNYIRLDHGNGVQTFYGSNQELLVQKGEQAAQGQSIARLGSTGKSTGPHCHWEVWVEGRPVDPTDYLTYSTESGERRPADPMIWVYEPARSSVFPALPVEFDPNVAGDGEKIGGIQVSAGGGTFYRHDESKYPNYQDQGQSCQYLLYERLYWSPGLIEQATEAEISFQAQGQPGFQGKLILKALEADPMAYQVSLEAQGLFIQWNEARRCFVVREGN